jgi:predicted SprT family Zn-dependent metalloprotease
MITKRQFNTLEDLFSYYNEELFGGKLPDVMINMSRKKNARAFFAPERWRDQHENKVHEISMNPDSLDRDDKLWHSTLVHEMTHLWQSEFGKPSRTGYHNKEWASKMEAIGLMPSDTGEKGGNKVGQNMTHYIIDNGAFIRAFSKLSEENLNSIKLPYAPIVYGEVITKKGTKSKSGVKIKYSCPCGNNIWGKEGIHAICEDCEEQFEPEN